MSDPSDNLAYDGELGWIDPECPMESLGIECEETVDHYTYRVGNTKVLMISKLLIKDRLDFAKARLCVQDAEERYMTWQ